MVYLAPRLLGLREAPPRCAPCDRRHVPWFDRWAIAPERPAWGVASDVGVLAILAGTWVDQARSTNGGDRVVVSLEATSWAVAVTELTKAVVGRKRPVLYTHRAQEAARVVDNRRSMPSGHTAAAFALTTIHWLNQGSTSTGGRLLLTAAAAGLGATRVVAARHFPSDVAAGALVGILSAVVVHEIRF